MTTEEQKERDPQDAEESGEGGGSGEEQGPDAEDLNEDPAYNPDDEGLKRVKGG